MKRRSRKIFAATLALLVCLNAMPLGTLAAEGEQADPATEQSAPAAEDALPSSVDGTEGAAADTDTNTGEDVSANADTDTNAGEDVAADVDTDTNTGVDVDADADTDANAGEDAAANADANADVDGNDGTDVTADAGNDASEDGTDVKENSDESASQIQKAAKAPAANTMLLDANTDVLYVENTGSEEKDKAEDEDGDAQYGTLAGAVSAANGLDAQQVTIELNSDITATKCARIIDKDIILDGNNYTITRGDGFKTIADNNRHWYNPAMIEVTVPNEKGASLTLVDVTLDDAGKTEGTIFAQAPGGDASSDGYVQDAIVAAYGTDNATAEIILGNGAVLQNFGGMSAVRVTGGATLTMQNGSTIQDTTVKDRILGTTGSNGPAGAVWVQGTTATMEDGAEITNVVGRAFYVDGGSVTVSGRITGITADSNMWQGTAGIGLHVRGGATATLASPAYIGDIDTNASGGSVLGIYGSNLDMQQGAVLQNVKGIMALYMDDADHGYTHTALVNGTVDHVVNNPVMRSWYGLIELGPTGVVQNCEAPGDGQVLYSNNGSHYVLEGKILNNTGTAVYLANQSGGRVEGVMKDGAVISGTKGLALRVNNGTLFTMEGGKISGNTSGVRVSGKDQFAGVTFIMNGGQIVGNETGLTYESINKSQVQLNGGEISGNTGAQIRASGGSAVAWNDTYKDPNTGEIGASYENFYLQQNVLKNAPIVQVDFGTLTLDDAYPEIWMGRASEAAETEIDKQVTSAEGRENWQAKGDSLWFKMETADTLHFTMERPSSVEQGIGLYAAYLPLKADGTPADGAELKLIQLTNQEKLDITLKGLTPGTSYALMLVVSDKYYVTITPADITVYMGGEHGYEGVVSSEGKIEGSNSLPEPGFRVDLPKNVKPEEVTIQTTDTTDEVKSWTFVPYDEKVPDSGIYKIKAAKGQDPVRVQFTNTEGKVVVSDAFDVGTAVNQTLTMEIYKNNVTEVEAVKKDDVTSGTTYGVILNKGTLTVRGTTGKEQYGAKIEKEEDAKAGTPAFLAPSGVTFTINDSSVPANQNSIALLFDNIIENTNSETGRTALLTQKANEVLKDEPVPAGMVRNYQFKYLDLVDTSNGNAWVDVKDANDGQAAVTVCWPYPEGTNKDTEFAVLHFEDLHRDMAANDVANDIESSTVSKVNILKKTDTHIEFTTTEFSPFALAWNSPKPVPPVVEEEKPENDNDEGGTTTTPAATPAPTAQPAAQTTAAQSTSVIPQTSDDSQPALWAGLLVFSGAALAALYLLKRRKQNREQ